MNSLKGLPKSVQSEIRENLIKDQELIFEGKKVTHARNVIQLRRKYSFRRNRLGLN